MYRHVTIKSHLVLPAIHSLVVALINNSIPVGNIYRRWGTFRWKNISPVKFPPDFGFVAVTSQ